MQIIISVKVLAALADIADKANGNEYSDKIAFFPGTDNAVACNGHILAFTDGACEIEGGSIVNTISAKRAKIILSEAKTNKAAKVLGKIVLFSTSEEYDDYINEQGRTPDCFPYAAYSFVPDYRYIPEDGIRKYLNEEKRAADDFVPTYNIKYQKKASKLWCAVSGFRNEDDPRYNKVYIGKSNTLHTVWEDNTHEGKTFHAVIMPYLHG